MKNVTYNGFDLQTDNIVTTNISFEDIDSKNMVANSLATRDGAKLIHTSHSNRQITLTGYIKGTDADNLEVNIDNFKKNINNVRDKELVIDYAGSTRTYIATESKLIFDREFFSVNVLGFTLTFYLADPFGIDTADTEIGNFSYDCIDVNTPVSAFGIINDNFYMASTSFYKFNGVYFDNVVDESLIYDITGFADEIYIRKMTGIHKIQDNVVTLISDAEKFSSFIEYDSNLYVTYHSSGEGSEDEKLGILNVSTGAVTFVKDIPVTDTNAHNYGMIIFNNELYIYSSGDTGHIAKYDGSDISNVGGNCDHVRIFENTLVGIVDVVGGYEIQKDLQGARTTIKAISQNRGIEVYDDKIYYALDEHLYKLNGSTETLVYTTPDGVDIKLLENGLYKNILYIGRFTVGTEDSYLCTYSTSQGGATFTNVVKYTASEQTINFDGTKSPYPIIELAITDNVGTAKIISLEFGNTNDEGFFSRTRLYLEDENVTDKMIVIDTKKCLVYYKDTKEEIFFKDGFPKFSLTDNNIIVKGSGAHFTLTGKIIYNKRYL